MARSSRTVSTPSSAASRFGRSPRSKCERDSRINTIGSPVGLSIARTRHRSPTQMYASSGAPQAVHSRSPSPRRGGSVATGSSSCLTRRSPSKGKEGHWVKFGTEGGVSGTRVTLAVSGTAVPTSFDRRSVGSAHRRPSAPDVIHRRSAVIHSRLPQVNTGVGALFHVKQRHLWTTAVDNVGDDTFASPGADITGQSREGQSTGTRRSRADTQAREQPPDGPFRADPSA